MREGDSSLAGEGRQQRSGYRRGATAGERGARAATSGRAALPSSMVQREFESPPPAPVPQPWCCMFSAMARAAHDGDSCGGGRRGGSCTLVQGHAMVPREAMGAGEGVPVLWCAGGLREHDAVGAGMSSGWWASGGLGGKGFGPIWTREEGRRSQVGEDLSITSPSLRF